MAMCFDQEREVPTPLQELYPNSTNLKKRRVSKKANKLFVEVNLKDDDVAVAAAQHCRAQ